MSLIEASHLHKAFGQVQAVKDVSLSIEAGEIYGLVGSDGAGKTTTLHLLIGALRPEVGSISIGGHDVLRHPERARALTGYLSQRFSLYEDLTVLENIRFFAEVRGLSRREWLPRCLEILDFVGLAPFRDRLAAHLSGGMKQKLALASALVTYPRVLLLDEPTTGVDPVTRQDFWQLIVRLVTASFTSEGMKESNDRRAVLLTTPYMDEAARCTRIGFMREGRIIAEGTPAELCAPWRGRVLEVRAASLSSARQIVRSIEGVEEVHTFGDRFHLRLKAGSLESVSAALDALAASRPELALQFRPITPTLEDVFIALTS